MSSTPWFRLYSEVLSDRKLKRVCVQSGHPMATVLGVWVSLLAMANESPQRGYLLIADDMPFTIEEIGAEIGLDYETVEAIISAFAQVQMVHFEDDCLVITHWESRQFSSDSSKDRVKKYREKRETLGMPVTPRYDSKQIISRDNGHCVYCASDQNLCVDHIYPIELGGTDHTNNLAAACKECNSGKSGRTPELAGYTFINKEAEARYQSYLKLVTVTTQPVTVTVTPPEAEAESEADKESSASSGDVPTKEQVAQKLTNYYLACKDAKINLAANFIDEFLMTYPPWDIDYAITEAIKNNAYKLAYIEAICKRRKNGEPDKPPATNGANDGQTQTKRSRHRSPGTTGERKPTTTGVINEDYLAKRRR